MMIDEVDIRILKNLQSHDWKGTIAELAEGLKVSEEDVQARTERLKEARIILYYTISLTPWIFGGEWIWAEAFINLRNPLFRYNVIEELKAKLEYYDGATTNTVIPTGSGADLSMTFHARSEDEYQQEVQKINDIEGVAKVTALKLEHANVPQTELDDVDWKMLTSLKQGIMKTLGKEMDTGRMKKENRLNRLVEGKKLFFLAAINFSRIDNWAHIHVEVTLQRKLSQEDIAELEAASISPPHSDWKNWGTAKGVLTIEPRSFKEFMEKANKILGTGMKIKSFSVEDRDLPCQPWLDKLLNSKGTRIENAQTRD